MKNTIVKMKNDYVEYKQFHAGKLKGVGDSVWHSECYVEDVIYWSGSWHLRTAEELMAETLTILEDLMQNHPELQSQFKEFLLKRLGL